MMRCRWRLVKFPCEDPGIAANASYFDVLVFGGTLRECKFVTNNVHRLIGAKLHGSSGAVLPRAALWGMTCQTQSLVVRKRGRLWP